MNRRAFISLLGGGAGLAWVRPAPAAAASRPDREHRIQLEVPLIADTASAVPLRIALDHPMDADHHIRAIEVTVEQDPVPDKGRFLLTPANGRAHVAYQMRSGTGGVLTVVAECTRHGAIRASQEFRVVEGGCSTPPERGARERAGSPEVRLPRVIRAGEPFEVRARLIHGSHTGLILRGGRLVRVAPEYYVREMVVWLDDQRVSEFRMTSAVSPNPLVRFPLRVARPGTLRVEFVNSEGQRWEASQEIRL